MEAKIISKTAAAGENHYRINPDGTYSALAFGSFGPGQIGLKYGWIDIPENKLPKEIKELLK